MQQDNYRLMENGQAIRDMTSNNYLSVGQPDGVVDFPDHFRAGARRLPDHTEVFRDRIHAVSDRQTALNHGQYIHDPDKPDDICTAHRYRASVIVALINDNTALISFAVVAFPIIAS